MAINLLILEKDAAFRQKLVRYLGAEGLTVFEAGGAKEALRILEASPVDVALVGVERPGRGASNLLKVIRRTSPDTAVILVSRQLDVSFSMEGMKLGAFDEFLVPFDMERLTERIREAHGERAVPAVGTGR